MRAVERLRSWDGRLVASSVAASIYQAFVLRLAKEVARAAIGDRDLAERWLDRADNGFIAHVTSPWRWHSHLMDLWEEADESLVGRPWETSSWTPCGAPSTIWRRASGPIPKDGAGARSTRWSSRTPSGRPTRCCAAC